MVCPICGSADVVTHHCDLDKVTHLKCNACGYEGNISD